MRVSNKFLGVSLIVAALILVNGYLLLKNNDVILKSYYIDDLQFTNKDIQQEELVKDAAVVSSMQHYISTSVDSISEVTVNKGQTIGAFESLATYRSEDAIAAREELENKLSAYEDELFELKSILSTLKNESDYSNSSTSSDGSTFGNDAFNIDLTVKLGIEQNTPTAEGVAVIQRHIAETTREIDILNSQINSINEANALTTPIDGIVEDIILEGDMITFVVQSSTKKLVTYMTKEEWLKVELDQVATFTIFEGDDEREQTIDGFVTQKQQIPAGDSLGYETLLQNTKLSKEDTVYEVSIEPNDLLDTTPLGDIVEVSIVTNEAYDSYETYSDWVVDYEVPNVGSQHVYTVGYDGKTRLTPITVAFEHKTAIDRERKPIVTVDETAPAEEAVEETVVEETTPARIQNVILEDKKEEEVVKEEKQQLDEATVFSAPLEDTALILNGSEKNIFAPTYRPFPFETFEKVNVGTFTWKDAIRYMLPQ